MKSETEKFHNNRREMKKVKMIFIVPYCHADWAWTFTRRWHEKRYVLVFDEVLDTLRNHPEFRWYFDTYKTEVEPFLKKRPEKFRELRQRIHEGKIGICGTYTNLRPSMVGEETQIRDILMGRKVYGKLFPGADLTVYASTVDVSAGHPQMPQILKKTGYRYFRFWRPHTALSAKKIPLEFYWKGQDGSKVLCSRGPYPGFNYYRELEKNFKDELDCDRELSPAGIRWISMGMDDTRPLRTPYEDKKIPVFRFMNNWNSSKRTPVAFAVPSEYFKEIEKENLPEIEGSLDPCEVSYNVGWGGSNGLFCLRQANEVNLTEVEKWTAIASLLGFKNVFGEIGQLWEKHLLSCAHSTQWLFEEDFCELLQIAIYVKQNCNAIKKKVLSFLSDKLSGNKNSEFIIFNPLCRNREEKIFLNIALPMGETRFKLCDGSGKNVPFQVIDTNSGGGPEEKIFEHRIMAKLILPSTGYNTISVIKGKKDKKQMENVPFSVKMHGAEITRVEAFGKIYQAHEGNSFGNLKLYRVDTTKGVLHVGPVTGHGIAEWKYTEKQDDGELYASYHSQGRIGKHNIERRVFIYKDEARIEFHTQVDWKKQDGFLTLEFPIIPGGVYHGDFPFGVEEKRMDIESFDRSFERYRKNLFFAKSFITCTDKKKSISYVNYDATHYYILNEKSIGNILLNSFTKRQGWERFINKSIMCEGQHKFVSHLIFHPGDWKKYHLPAEAERFVYPPEVLYVRREGKGRLSSVFSFLSISPPNLVLTAFYKEGDYYILRFYEAEGVNTSAEIRYFKPLRQVAKTDIEIKKIVNLSVKQHSVRFNVKPNEIVTLRVLF